MANLDNTYHKSFFYQLSQLTQYWLDCVFFRAKPIEIKYPTLQYKKPNWMNYLDELGSYFLVFAQV